MSFDGGPGVTSARVLAHAKINLLLRVLEREANGFHGIETLFQALELADDVELHLNEADRTLSCDGPAMPTAGLGSVEQNLAMRAATAYTGATKWETGWSITIEKNIPVGGGLGGGSADAAAVLTAFESLAPQPLGRSALLELAGTLGSDVPFLVSASPLAWGWNRGDRLLPLQTLPRMDVTLFTFSEGVSTGAAYKSLSESRNQEIKVGKSRGASYPADAFSSWSSIAGMAANDFETVVPALHEGVARWLPVVRHTAARLTAQGTPALGLMSGSGATCFVLSAPGLIPDFASGNGMRVIKTHTLSALSGI
ncbi:MAG: hypothetical protein ABJB66_07700 [Gemmatimonadaceae bacterium]